MFRPIRKVRQGRGEPERLGGLGGRHRRPPKQIGIENVSVRTTSAAPARSSAARPAADSEQIKFLLGHSSIQTTERYLGSEQDIAVAVNDNIGIVENA